MVARQMVGRTVRLDDPAWSIRTGYSHEYIPYGPDMVFEDEGQLKLAVRSVVYEPVCTRHAGTVRLELGEDAHL